MGFSASRSRSNQSSTQDSLQESDSSSAQTSTSSSRAFNQSFPSLSELLRPSIDSIKDSVGGITGLLGLRGGDAQTEAFQNFINSSAFGFLQREGIRGVEAGNASKGLLNSGSTIRGGIDYNNNLSRQYLNDYFSQLISLGGIGNQSASVLSGAGGVSESNASSTSLSQQRSRGTSTGRSQGTSSGNSFGLSL